VLTVTVYAATGHRPDKLGGFGAHYHNRLVRVAAEFLAVHRPSKCISGMALGWDMAYAEAALSLGIPLLAAVPFAGQQSMWPLACQQQYQDIIDRAADVIIVSQNGFSARAMQVRNEWMVDHADVIAAMFDGSRGGTYNCLWYAHTNNKPIINLYDQWRRK
jgi:uncharacterized phage-like protein YoqJ